jgi:SAM-dependent methyltransferase
MKILDRIALTDVQAVYAGPEGDLWELIMGEQIHLGGLQSSLDLAAKAGIAAGSRGVDLCCCTGAGMRCLVRLLKVRHMTGVDATPKVIQRGRQRAEEEGLAGQIEFVQASVCDCPLPSASADFVWGEDAWCYVTDKLKLVEHAARIVRPGGVIAFTDWMEGAVPMTAEEANRYLAFMKFPSILTLNEYADLLVNQGCDITVAEDTRRFAPCVDLYLNMLNQQLAFDALKIIGFDQALMQSLGSEMQFLQTLARAGKIIQGRIVARKA